MWRGRGIQDRTKQRNTSEVVKMNTPLLEKRSCRKKYLRLLNIYINIIILLILL